MKHALPFNRNIVILSQGLLVLIGFGVFVFMLWEPHLEGRNVNATLLEIYFKDPFLAYVYMASVPFFMSLWQAFKILGQVEQNKVVSQESLQAWRKMKYCAFIIIGFVAMGEFFLMLSESDDRAGGIVVGGFIAIISIAIATTAAIFEGVSKKALTREVSAEKIK